jgi:para-nitrobenzyl esterase
MWLVQFVIIEDYCCCVLTGTLRRGFLDLYNVQFRTRRNLMNTVKLDTGYISGSVSGEPGKEVYIYRGIPYAAPPIGDLRWKPPQQAAPWSGIRECTKYSIQAAQYADVHGSNKLQKLPSSEDCLYLNVLTPAKKTNDKLPVMVWYHGGGVRYGNGNLPISNSLGLPNHGVLLVTVNTRLGILGLFAHPSISRESPQGASGNYLFLDMIASLKWIKKNIAAFGGDPDNITIFGQSGGGLKVATMIASPLAKGLFQQAIIQSGGRTFDPILLKDLEKFGEKYFARLGVDKDKDPLAAARAIPWERIVEIEQAFNVELGHEYEFMGPWHMVEDGWFFPGPMLELCRTGKGNPVPFMAVATMGELTGPGIVVEDRMIANYIKLLSALDRANSRGYAAVFDWVPVNWRQEGCVCPHGLELHYIFGSLDIAEAWEAHSAGFAYSGAKSPMPILSEVDTKISEAMMSVWTQFARTGNPSVKGLIEWPAWDKDGDQYLYVNETLKVKTRYSDLAKIKAIKLSNTV